MMSNPNNTTPLAGTTTGRCANHLPGPLPGRCPHRLQYDTYPTNCVHALQASLRNHCANDPPRCSTR